MILIGTIKRHNGPNCACFDELLQNLSCMQTQFLSYLPPAYTRAALFLTAAGPLIITRLLLKSRAFDILSELIFLKKDRLARFWVRRSLAPRVHSSKRKCTVRERENHRACTVFVFFPPISWARVCSSLEPGPSRAKYFPRDMLLLPTTAPFPSSRRQ